MDNKQLESLFGMYSEAVIAIGGNEIAYYNAAAQKLLPNIKRLSPSELFPAAVLELESDSFVGELDLAGKRSTYSAVRFGEFRIFSVLDTGTDAERFNAAAFSAMSVEMKNYLSVLRLASSFVLPYVENTGDERLAAYAAMINKSYYNILRLTGNMEVLGTNPGASGGIKRTSFDLAMVCGELISVCAHLVDDRRVNLTFSSADEEMFIYGDKDKLSQMILNMLSNSLIYTPEGGSVSLSLSVSGESALIKVSDTGVGIPESVKSSAWCRYGEPKTLSDTRSGAGFGMAAVSQIARLHGGSVFFESRQGEGTTIAASIPLSREDASSFREKTETYQTNGISPYLTGLATVVGNEKFTQKYMD